MKQLPPSKHVDLSPQYGAPATLTVAWFEHCGVAHVATRFWRSDFLSTGKIEIYTVEPHDPASDSTELGWYYGATQDFLRYADEACPSRTDVAAMLAIAAVDGSFRSLHADQAARFAALELA